MAEPLNDAAFAGLSLPLYEKSVCSPDIGDALGLRVAAPRTLAPVGAFPLSGTLRLPLDEARRIQPNAIEAVTVVVVDVARREPFVFTLVPDKEPAVEPESDDESPPAKPSTAKVSEWFNVDLRHFQDLPRHPGTYVVYGILRGYRSNVLEVVIPEKGS